ncbi:RagB/SusD family nutrient uptake outer membrane protein [Proteiniphilum sp. UBA5480]|uniref:RagB/SusD family nutrient uptake outer membrane protein n=1 Tax=Proteiniphilum sp. UBA5480 TaxID=1947282 RepID=UPI000E912C23|nr:RagB/SusD family nutrient uptake outer membrane protein [Proteiniphilum sp. UBA5480]HBK30668.1 hypothetical protein [Porphyromonadaceae bacterium]HBX18901.1 hypothetical protein [Porphyromonadaceae bacterium]HCM21146.1 hypothetical protein [Porphyromonadaceae bacterium]
MKHNSNFCIINIMLILALISCDNALDQKPVDSFNEESMFEDINLSEAFLYQCYDVMGGDHTNVLGMREDLLSSSTDELLNIHRAGEVTFTKGTLTPDYLGHFGNDRYGWILWNYNYSNIKNVNTLLGGIDGVPVNSNADEKRLAQIKAEAYFIRAFNYTNLLRSYGGVVLIDKKFNLKDDFLTHERATLQQTVDFILSDLEKAIAGLPDKSEIAQGRATKGAAAALKSRLLSFVTGELMNGGYEAKNDLVSFQDDNRKQRLTAAKNAAKDIIDGKYGTYALSGSTTPPPVNMSEEEFAAYVDNYSNIFLQKGAWNDEVIFGIQYVNRQGNQVSNNLYWGPNGYNCWGNNEPTEDIIRQFEMKDGSPFKWDKYKPGEANIREFKQEELKTNPDLNPFDGREPRFYANVLYDGAPWRERASTDSKVQIASKVNAPGTSLMGGQSVAEKMQAIAKLESVSTGGNDSRQAANQAWNGTKTGYYLRKMLDITLNGEIDNNENAWIEIRFAEVLLDYAEACIELDEIEEGLKTINKIRNRAGLPDRPLNVNQDQARKWYRHERLIEMFAEGDRWYCIRKWMICNDVIKKFHPLYIYHFNDGVSMYIYNTTALADTRKWENKNYWLPISRTEINKAPKLKQNPGY